MGPPLLFLAHSTQYQMNVYSSPVCIEFGFYFPIYLRWTGSDDFDLYYQLPNIAVPAKPSYVTAEIHYCGKYRLDLTMFWEEVCESLRSV